MSRLTGTDAYGLMEAYNNVYTPQELTEEQVWEEVETWVNSLIEEGYDLSDYTWEEMYESYIEEQAGGIYATTPAPISNAPYQSRFSRPRNAGTVRTYSGQVTARPQIGSLPSSARQVTQYPQGVSTGVGGGNAGASKQPVPRQQPRQQPPAARPAAGSPARPAAAPTRPVAGAPTRPAATAPATPKPAAPAGGSALDRATAAASKPTAFSPKPQSDVGAMIARSQARQSAQTPKPATSTATAKPTPRQARLNMEMEYDTYDTVLEHLVSEGYADTEESALVIMANMSEEWKQSIVEETLDERRNVTDKPLGIMHRFARGVRTRKGEKTEPMGSDREGNPTGKYLRMKHEKKAAQREKDADEQRRRDSGAMSRGTWDKD